MHWWLKILENCIIDTNMQKLWRFLSLYLCWKYILGKKTFGSPRWFGTKTIWGKNVCFKVNLIRLTNNFLDWARLKAGKKKWWFAGNGALMQYFIYQRLQEPICSWAVGPATYMKEISSQFTTQIGTQPYNH